jgi:hypothetical protein
MGTFHAVAWFTRDPNMEGVIPSMALAEVLMRRRSSWGGLIIGISVCSQACGDGAPMGPDLALDSAQSSTSSDDQGATSAALSDMPCEVSSLLSTYCISCHQRSLASVDELKMPGHDGPGTMADEAVQRMRASNSSRMPPDGNAPSANEIAAFSAWVKQGLPVEGCAAADAGARDAAL